MKDYDTTSEDEYEVCEKGTILVIDDEGATRDSCRQVLTKDGYRQKSFWREKDRELENREYYRFFFDYMITTPRIGQVPEQPTRMQETCKATFIHRASIIGRLSRLPDRRALPASGTWPTFDTNRLYVMEPLYKK